MEARHRDRETGWSCAKARPGTRQTTRFARTDRTQAQGCLRLWFLQDTLIEGDQSIIGLLLDEVIDLRQEPLLHVCRSPVGSGEQAGHPLDACQSVGGTEDERADFGQPKRLRPLAQPDQGFDHRGSGPHQPHIQDVRQQPQASARERCSGGRAGAEPGPPLAKGTKCEYAEA